MDGQQVHEITEKLTQMKADQSTTEEQRNKVTRSVDSTEKFAFIAFTKHACSKYFHEYLKTTLGIEDKFFLLEKPMYQSPYDFAKSKILDEKADVKTVKKLFENQYKNLKYRKS